MNKLKQLLGQFPKKEADTPSGKLPRARWIALGLLLLAGLVLGAAYAMRPVQRQEVILLTGQSYALTGSGTLTVTGDAVRTEGDSLVGVQEGTAEVRVSHLTSVEEYSVQVFAPEPQGERKQRVGVDGYIALAAVPKDYPVTWTSSDPTVVTVEDGVANGVTTGTATVTETLNDFLTYTYEVTVTRPELVQDRYTVYPSQEVPVKVLYYSQPVEWTSDSDAVQVNGDGTVTSVKPGRANLTTQIGDETFTCRVQVARLPKLERQVTLRTDETAQLHLKNALGEVVYRSGDEGVVQVDDWGHLTPVGAGATTVTASCSGQTCTAQVVVNLTPEEQFRVSNYGSYQPDTSIAALAMLGICDYYNDEMKKSGDTWYDTNMTDFSPSDTFQEAISAKRKGANCNSLLNWSWHDMDLKKGSSSKIYGMRDSGNIHGYHSDGHPLRGLVDRCCTVISAHGEKTRSLENRGKLQSGDMLFMPLHTFIYRGKGTVFASAGDAVHRHKGKDLIILDCINDYHSYNWRKRITYIMRFKDDCIPRCYRNKDGEVVENPMYTALERGESPWTGKLSPAQREEAGLEPMTFLLGEEAVTALAERRGAVTEESGDSDSEDAGAAGSGTEESAAAESSAAEASTDPADASAAAEGSVAASGDTSTAGESSTPTGISTDVAEDAAVPAPITGDIVAVLPAEEQTDEMARMAGGKPYGARPSTGKKVKKKSLKSRKKARVTKTDHNVEEAE